MRPNRMMYEPGGRRAGLLLLALLLPTLAVAEPLRVFASVAPLQVFVSMIGGDHVDARALVRQGFDPHAYDPTPQQIGALTKTALYVSAGLPFERAWMPRILSANPTMQVLHARDGIASRTLEAHDHGHRASDPHAIEDDQHGHTPPPALDTGSHDLAGAYETDPHVWVSPPLVRHMAGRIRDKLNELAPAHAAQFMRNHDAFIAQLDALDRELHALLDPLPNRRFMVFHPAWGYFADNYGLTQVPIEHEGKEPGARALAGLIDQARNEGIRLVFVQPQFDRRRALQVAKAINGTVVSIDPLAADYFDSMRRVGREIARALQP